MIKYCVRKTKLRKKKYDIDTRLFMKINVTSLSFNKALILLLFHNIISFLQFCCGIRDGKHVR